MNHSVSAYIPCFNNAATVRQAVESVLAQTIPIDEVVVIDDGSTDGSVRALAGLPVRTVRHEKNLGRGAARARAMEELRSEWVLAVDALNVIPRDFLAGALLWGADKRVAAVCGRIQQYPARNVVERWRGRHLFKLDQPAEINRRAALSSGAVLVRAASVRDVGGYAAALRHSEDIELGTRLLGAGHDVVWDPGLGVYARGLDSVGHVLERYWRWNLGRHDTASWREYLRQVWYSWKVMVRADLAQGDVACALISLACPHYCFGRMWRRRRTA